MERPRGVNCIKTAGGRRLCTLHRGKGLYGQVRYWGYMRDSRLEIYAGRHPQAPATQAGLYTDGPLQCTFSMVVADVADPWPQHNTIINGSLCTYIYVQYCILYTSMQMPSQQKVRHKYVENFPNRNNSRYVDMLLPCLSLATVLLER